MEFVGLVTSDKETWGQVSGLIKNHEWEKIIILTDQNDFDISKEHETIKVDPSHKIVEMKTDILKKIKNKISGTEVALSIASGTGKEHMALISALLAIPVGIRLVALTKDGIVNL